MGRFLVRLDLLSSLRGILWVPHRQAPEHFMVVLWKPRLVLSGLAEQEQASSECLLERNSVALCEIFAWSVPFWRKKYSPLGVAPEPLAIWYKEQEGLVLKSLWSFIEMFSSVCLGFFIKKNSDIARSGFFLSWVLEVVLSWRSLLGDVCFFEEKSALTECSPRASCYLEQGAGGSCLEIALSFIEIFPSVCPGSL